MTDRAQDLRATLGSIAASLRSQDSCGVSGQRDVAQRIVTAAEAALSRLDAEPPDPTSIVVADAPRASSGESVVVPAPSVALTPEAQLPAETASVQRREASSTSSRAAARKSASDGSLPWVPRRDAAPAKGVGSDELMSIRTDLGDCERCGLCARRTNIVFGVGSPSARLMFIGEAPGADEDRKGEPFVGRAGQLLDKMIGAMGLSRAEVYIANVVKCRPPGNRDPQSDEVAACRPFLDRQIAAIKPDAIVTLGRVAAATLLSRNVAIMRERGKWTSYRDVPLMLTLHPAYLLREPRAKADAWADLQLVMKRLGLERAGR